MLASPTAAEEVGLENGSSHRSKLKVSAKRPGKPPAPRSVTKTAAIKEGDQEASGDVLLDAIRRDIARRDEELRSLLCDFFSAQLSSDAREAFQQKIDYWRLVRRIRELVPKHVPIGSVVLVVAKGDNELLVLAGRQGQSTSSSRIAMTEGRAQRVSITGDALVVDLIDSRTIAVPLSWYPRLAHGTNEARAHWRIIGEGEGLHWPELDEDVSVEGLLAGRRSGETPASLRRWFETRKTG